MQPRLGEVVKVRPRRWGLIAVLAILALVTAPLSVQASTVRQPTKTLRVAYTTDIDSLNPFKATLLVSTQIGRLMYEYLTVASAKDSSPEPGVAERWESAPDGLTWTFHLRKNMQWTDGKPITAKDVAFTYNLIMTNKDAAEANAVAVTNYESVTAKDDSTLVIKTKQPMAAILTSEIPIVPEHIWKDVTDIKNFKNDKFPVVGSGPFVLTGYQEGQSVTLEANDKFWRGRSKIDKLQYVKYESTEAAVQGLRKGDVDLAYRLTATQFKQLEKEQNIKTNAGNNRRFNEIIINSGFPKADGSPWGNGNPVLKDVEFRKALSHAVDVKTIVDKVKQGLAEPATQIIPTVFPDWTFKPSDSQKRGFDVAKANSILDTAGYAKGGDGTRADKQGKPINLRLLVTSDDTERRQISEYVKGWFKEIGVGVNVEFKGSNQVNDDTTAGNFDLSFSGWSVSPDPEFMLAQETCEVVGTDLGDSNFCDQEFDKLYKQQQAELDKGKRMQLVQQAQGVLHDKVAALLLTYDKQLEAYRSDRFANFPTQPANSGVITNQSGYWGYYGATPAGMESASGPSPAASDDDSGMSTGAVVGIVGGAAVLVAGGVWLLSRRRRITADERE